jgi:hypothetical protein
MMDRHPSTTEGIVRFERKSLKKPYSVTSLILALPFSDKERREYGRVRN